MTKRMLHAVLLSIALAFTGCLDPGEPGNLVPRTVVEDPSLPRIEIAGALFHAEAFGDPAAPIVMVLHGGPGSDYRALLPLKALTADGYRVVFWDQRGAGLSQRFPASHYTMPGYLEDLRLVVEHYTVVPGQPVAFIGHSWGAMYLTWFINEYGDYGGRVRGAILSEPGAFTKAQLDDFMGRFTAAYSITGEPLNDVFWADQFMSANDQARADYLRRIGALEGPPFEHDDPSNPAPAWRLGAVVNKALTDLAEQGFDWTTHLGAFDRKVLFLRGELNTVATLEHQRGLAASWPVHEIITIPGTGHEMIWERPDEYLAHTRAYFQSIGFAGGAR
jgi:proline iminopeptidase